MTQKEITVLMVAPGQHPNVATLKDDLDSLQRAVSMSRNIDDLETLLFSQYLVCFDNIDKTFSKEFSDTFCVAVTGGTVARRKKFNDTEVQ